MAGKGVELAGEGVHVHRHRPQRLCPVHQKGHARLPRCLPDGGHRLDGPGDVGGVGHGDEPRVFAQRAAHVLGVDEAVRPRGEQRQFDLLPPQLFGQHAQNGIVF